MTTPDRPPAGYALKNPWWLWPVVATLGFGLLIIIVAPPALLLIHIILR